MTTIDAAAVLQSRSARRSRGGILGFLSGETRDESEVPSEADLERLAPPGGDVRMEIVRLELEAFRGRLAAEAAALAAEAAVEESARPTASPPSTVPPGPAPSDD
ncbi:MAG: hypothetical protein IVW53_04940 [Chloroflexi bacterium]|nr:hypothetical protein [Chloroflexota bacterium]